MGGKGPTGLELSTCLAIVGDTQASVVCAYSSGGMDWHLAVLCLPITRAADDQHAHGVGDRVQGRVYDRGVLRQDEDAR